MSFDNKKLLLICIVFLAIFFSVLIFRSSLRSFDLVVYFWIPSIQTRVLSEAALVIAFLFETYSLLAATVAIALVLFLKNYGKFGLLLIGAMSGVSLIVTFTKVLVHSTRPPTGLVANSGYAFPSGHAAGSVVFCGLLTYFAWRHWKSSKIRAPIISLSAVTVSVVCFDRLYLSVHWFSDVLGGFTLGVCLLTLFILLFRLLSTTSSPNKNQASQKVDPPIESKHLSLLFIRYFVASNTASLVLPVTICLSKKRAIFGLL